MPYDGEEFELALALRAGAGGHDVQGLGAVLGERDLGADLDPAEGGMEDRLALAVAPGDPRRNRAGADWENGPMSIVKINVLTVPEEQRETLEKRFANRAGTVDSSDGFEWFELLRPVEGTDTYLVYTRWRAEEDFQNWMSGMGQAAHRGASQEGAPQGERPRPAATDSTLWTFEVVQQAGPKES